MANRPWVLPTLATMALSIFGWYLLCRVVPRWPLCWCSTPPIIVEACCEDDCPECVLEPEATISVQEAHHGTAWIPFDNGAVTRDAKTDNKAGKVAVCADDAAKAFAPGCTYSTEFRAGVQFQLGEVRDGTWRVKDVIIEHSGGPVETLPYTAFDWINVYPAGADCVIDALHAYALFRHPDFPGEPYKLVTTECDGAGEILDAKGFKFICAREREIHAGIEVTGGVLTLWPGEEYHLELGGFDAAEHHGNYTFKLCDEMIADIFQHGCFDKRLSGVRSITITSESSSSDHGGIHDSPQDGGKVGVGP